MPRGGMGLVDAGTVGFFLGGRVDDLTGGGGGGDGLGRTALR